MSPNEPREASLREQLDWVLSYLRRALRCWPVPLGALLLGGLACAVFLRLRSPSYRSETVILYVEKGSAEGADESGKESRSAVSRLKELVLSHSTLARVLTEFDLYPERRRKLGTLDAIEELKKHIDFRAPGGDTIRIAFEGDSPGVAQRVTAELAELGRQGDAKLRAQQADVALKFLVGERASKDSELQEAEQNLASFMALHPRFAYDLQPRTNGVAIRANLADGTDARARALPRRAAPASGAAAGSNVPAGAGAQAAASDASGAQALARASLAAARERLNAQMLLYTGAHPDVRAAQAELARASARLAALESSGPVVANGSGTAPLAAVPGRTPQKAWTAAPPAAAAGSGEAARKDVVELETQWLLLTRAVSATRERQDQVAAQWFKADMLASAESAGRGVQLNVIDPAFLPAREQPPGLMLIVLLFALGSLALAGVAAVVSVAFDDRLFVAGDLLGVGELLVAIPNIARERSTVSGHTLPL